ncbi:MAG: alpha/beta hydrolase [Limnohabitans sp.]
MNAATLRCTFSGPAGTLQGLRDLPPGPPRGTAVIAHPHPLFGGTMDNKVVQTLARAFVQCGWEAVRFNFRGVEASGGQFDEGVGETDDLLAVIAQAAPTGALALAGFSFGAFVTARALAGDEVLARRPAKTILVGLAASRFHVPPLSQTLHEQTLVVHGERDETVPLASVLDWARPQHLPVTVVPGVEHFFHGQLPLLRRLAVHHLQA